MIELINNMNLAQKIIGAVIVMSASFFLTLGGIYIVNPPSEGESSQQTDSSPSEETVTEIVTTVTDTTTERAGGIGEGGTDTAIVQPDPSPAIEHDTNTAPGASRVPNQATQSQRSGGGSGPATGDNSSGYEQDTMAPPQTSVTTTSQQSQQPEPQPQPQQTQPGPQQSQQQEQTQPQPQQPQQQPGPQQPQTEQEPTT